MFCTFDDYFNYLIFLYMEYISIGTGKRTVEFFSTPHALRVCKCHYVDNMVTPTQP